VKTQSILDRFGQTCLSYFVDPLFLFVVAQFSECPIKNEKVTAKCPSRKMVVMVHVEK